MYLLLVIGSDAFAIFLLVPDGTYVRKKKRLM